MLRVSAKELSRDRPEGDEMRREAGRGGAIGTVRGIVDMKGGTGR